jgi:hypothetical protein
MQRYKKKLTETSVFSLFSIFRFPSWGGLAGQRLNIIAFPTILPTFFITPAVPTLRQSSLYPPSIRVPAILPPTPFPHNSVMIIKQIVSNLYG